MCIRAAESCSSSKTAGIGSRQRAAPERARSPRWSMASARSSLFRSEAAVKVRTDQLLKTSEVAKLLNVSEDTLKKWRGCGVGPAWLKLGAKLYSPIRYEPDSVN